MYKKLKSYYLKTSIAPYELTKYGFKECGVNYCKDLKRHKYIMFFESSRRIVFRDYPWHDARYRKVRKYIKDVINDGMVDLIINYEWLTLIGSYRNFSKEKREKIEKRIHELNKKARGE